MTEQDTLTLTEARVTLRNAGYKDVTEEANAQNKQDTYAVFVDPSGVGVHYCFDEEDVMDLAEVAADRIQQSDEEVQRVEEAFSELNAIQSSYEKRFGPIRARQFSTREDHI